VTNPVLQFLIHFIFNNMYCTIRSEKALHKTLMSSEREQNKLYKINCTE